MKNTKHTPGPWKRIAHFHPSTNRFQFIRIVSESGRQIATTDAHHGDEPLTPMSQFELSAQDTADAQLIAAAPELLEALERIAGDSECPDHVANYILPIILKAKGGE